MLFMDTIKNSTFFIFLFVFKLRNRIDIMLYSYLLVKFPNNLINEKFVFHCK